MGLFSKTEESDDNLAGQAVYEAQEYKIETIESQLFWERVEKYTLLVGFILYTINQNNQ